MDPMIVRPVEPADYPQWRPLWDGYNAFYGREGATALPEAVTLTTWGRCFDAYEPVHARVAEASGRLLGLVHYVFHRSTTLIGPTCYLQDLFADPAVRGRGVGRALIEAVYTQARQGNASRVYWQTHQANATARLLYDRIAEHAGFIVYRRDV